MRTFATLRTRMSDDRGSLPLLALIMLIGVGLTAGLVPAVISMSGTTQYTSNRVLALNAAQAGVDAAIGKIRNAATDSVGDASKLPCTTKADIAGVVQTSSTTASNLSNYRVSLAYYTADPVAHPEVAAMTCVPGAGTFDPASGKPTPSYVRITSSGTAVTTSGAGSTSTRTLVAVYAFTVDNTNINGGTIRIYSASGDGTNLWCVDAGSATPAAGTQLKLQPCSTTTPTDPDQTFAYRQDLTLQLVSSIGTTVNGTTYRNGLCVDVASLNSSGTAPASSAAVVLKQCATTAWSQWWSFNNHRSYQAPLKNSVNDGNLTSSPAQCWSTTLSSSSTHTAGSAIALGTCTNSLTSATDAWVPSPAVGAGAATKPASMQWINFQQFGRCLNVTNADASSPYLTVPNCFQNPNLSSVPEQQRWTYDSSTSRMYVTLNGTRYCLYSQLPASNNTNILDHRVLVTNCSTHPGVATRQMTWTYSSPALTPTLPYSQQYHFKDANNPAQCLSIGTVTVPNDSYGTQYDVWKKAITEDCDYTASGTRQMWNASNNVGTSSVQNIVEKSTTNGN